VLIGEQAVKEFSKARLRKRAASHFFRQPRGIRRLPGHLAAGTGLNAPLHHAPADRGQGDEPPNSLYLIKEEIAIMKKLDHNNLVSLIEVLDDPTEDSLYMVLEMCKKGVIMKVGLNEQADPYAPEDCRLWFRDMILGIEYREFPFTGYTFCKALIAQVHAQGVIHRDIKPDNLLLTADNVLKIVDFGVSEMFEKESNMRTAKSAGSPAFLPPELCIVRHGDVSGPAADIWSMGVSLYCLMYGRIPFEREGAMDMYEAIRTQEVDYTGNDDPKFLDLMHRILEKDPTKRITMDEMRVRIIVFIIDLLLMMYRNIRG
jgi:[calcium/calmodulin-dependent protein kinase] kinase